MSKRNATAVEVVDFDDLKLHGQFEYTGLYGVESETSYGMIFVCPCGCGAHGALAFDNRPADYLAKHPDMAVRPQWHWDGNHENPTLTPSIQRNTGCRWHGFLHAGVFEEC